MRRGVRTVLRVHAPADPDRDTLFLKSMIPHHSGAILMCGQADLTDPEIRQLCDKIIAAQREEIQQMEQILRRLGR